MLENKINTIGLIQIRQKKYTVEAWRKLANMKEDSAWEIQAKHDPTKGYLQQGRHSAGSGEIITEKPQHVFLKCKAPERRKQTIQ